MSEPADPEPPPATLAYEPNERRPRPTPQWVQIAAGAFAAPATLAMVWTSLMITQRFTYDREVGLLVVFVVLVITVCAVALGALRLRWVVAMRAYLVTSLVLMFAPCCLFWFLGGLN